MFALYGLIDLLPSEFVPSFTPRMNKLCSFLVEQDYYAVSGWLCLTCYWLSTRSSLSMVKTSTSVKPSKKGSDWKSLWCKVWCNQYVSFWYFERSDWKQSNFL